MEKILRKKIKKSQHDYGVAIDKEFHIIFNPPANTYYCKKGSSRKVIVLFNNKQFEARFLNANPQKGADNVSLRFSKELKEEFQIITPELFGYFTIQLGKDINEFIFKFVEGDLSDETIITKKENQLPTKADIELAASQTPLDVRGSLDIDAILNHVEENSLVAGKLLQENWRTTTEKNISIWFK